jgi:hypothetical protein
MGYCSFGMIQIKKVQQKSLQQKKFNQLLLPKAYFKLSEINSFIRSQWFLPCSQSPVCS